MFLLISIILLAGDLMAQDDLIYSDYMTFGRREPASPGNVFSALADQPVFLNPANVALVTDNRITLGGGYSDLGESYVLSWTAPNLSISSARHTASLKDSVYKEYRKELLKFSFAVSTRDLNITIKDVSMSAGIAVKTLADRLFDNEDKEFGGDALSIDVGFHVSWRSFALEMAMLNLNMPKIGETDLNYARTFSVVGRYRSPSGFILAVQGLSSSTYAGSDIGINLAAQQAFWDNRLISRVQLTSFFSGTVATMQNISGSIGYRPLVAPDLIILQDIEVSYTLSFLAMPQTVGTHLVVLTKYF
jgi:hypothetical protein